MDEVHNLVFVVSVLLVRSLSSIRKTKYLTTGWGSILQPAQAPMLEFQYEI